MRGRGDGMRGRGDGMRDWGDGMRGRGDGMRGRGGGMRGRGDGMRGDRYPVPDSARDATRVFVHGIPVGVTTEELMDAFLECGDVSHVKWLRAPPDATALHCVIEFATHESAAHALYGMARAPSVGGKVIGLRWDQRGSQTRRPRREKTRQQAGRDTGDWGEAGPGRGRRY